MSTYVRNQPVGTDALAVSQPKLATNTNAADDAFGTDHYAFSDTTGNRGFHNSVTTPAYLVDTQVPPVYPAVLPTTTTYPIIYAYQPTDGAGAPTTNLGLLQYSRGVTNAVPTPLTTIQSVSTPITLLNNTPQTVFDFTGMSRASCMFYGFNAATVSGTADPRAIFYVLWDGTTLYVSQIVSSLGFVVQASAHILQMTQTSGFMFSNVYWTLQFLRTS